MNAVCPRTITQLLQNVRAGETSAAESLLALAYSELGSLARSRLSLERSGHTLQPTALVHEAWLKLAGHLESVEDRRHFFAIASKAMRQVLTDHARQRNSQKRGGEKVRVMLDGSLAAPNTNAIDLVDFDDSLSRLASMNDRHARIVELRIFGGLTIAETAQTLEVSHATIESDWFTARAWLRRELKPA